jgi:hypothetical protein
MKKTKPKIKQKKNDEENFDYMKTNKDNLLNILKDDSILPIINELVLRTNKIVIHTYQFLKLYLLHLYENNNKFPFLDKEFICDIFKVITIRKCGSGGYKEDKMPDQLKELTKFYKEHYQPLMVKDDVIYYDKLSYILAYEAIDMITNINNNIQEHFLDHLNKYVNINFDIKSKREQITKDNKDKLIRKELHKNLTDEFKKVKNDLISFNELTADEKYKNWIIEERKKLYPNKTKFDKDLINYDLKSNTQDYLQSMFYLATKLEKINSELTEDKKEIRLFNVLPLRTNIVSKNIVIDTCALISNFLGKESTSEHLKNYKDDDNQYLLWEKFFKLNKKVFNKKQYGFNYMIRTDGISCCILFVRLDKDGKPLKKTIKNKKMCEEINTDYIEQTEITDELKKKKIITIDPGHSDLIYCGSKDEKGKLQTFRYTQNQRRLETRMKKYNKIMDTINKKTKYNEKTVKELEIVLSKYNSKTINYDKFKEYIIEKNKLNKILYDHYQQKIFRKLKLNRFINTQKSEAKMITNFKNKFGDSKNSIIVVGDYDKGDYNMKGKEPVILKKFRRIFKNAGYKTYLVNEFRTSKLCNHCHKEIESFLERKSNKPKLIKDKKNELVHGLLCHTDIKPKCEIIHNRDKNAVQNMLYIVETIFKLGKRPTIFTRTAP